MGELRYPGPVDANLVALLTVSAAIVANCVDTGTRRFRYSEQSS